jgi:hypothetical protein
MRNSTEAWEKGKVTTFTLRADAPSSRPVRVRMNGAERDVVPEKTAK